MEASGNSNVDRCAAFCVCVCLVGCVCVWGVCYVMLCLQVAKLKSTGKVYALKILNKWKMLKRHQVS